jgi:hypothetical protein
LGQLLLFFCSSRIGQLFVNEFVNIHVKNCSIFLAGNAWPSIQQIKEKKEAIGLSTIKKK